MCDLAEGAADAVVFCVVGGVCDCVASADGGGAVVVVGFVGGEIDFAEELLLVVLEFAAMNVSGACRWGVGDLHHCHE